MELIVSINKIKEINLEVDSLVLGSEFSVRSTVFTLAEIEAVKQKSNKNIYVNVNKIILEEELDRLEIFLLKLKEIDVDGIYFSCMSVYSLNRQIGLDLFYNPETLTTNYSDVLEYLALGIKKVVLAREITLESIKKIISKTTDVEVNIHGKLNMFYSKRKLLTNCFNNFEQEVKTKGFLREELREEYYPIIEDETGSHIFHGLTLSSYDEISNFSEIAVKIDGYLLEDLATVVNDYQRALSGEKIERAEDQFSGYYYKQTKYKK